MAVTAESEQNHAGAAFLARRQGLIDRRADGVRRFGRGQDALRARKLNGCLEDRKLRIGFGL